MMAVERILNGEGVTAVMTSFGLCRTTGYKWLAKVRGHGHGMSKLVARKGSGRPPRLTRTQKLQVFRWINGRSPQQNGLDLSLWTRAVVAKLIKDKFNVQLGLTAVGDLLAKLGLTPQKPKKRSVERNENDVEHWEKHIWPEQTKRLHNEARKAHIVFIDECGFMLAPLIKRTWALSGHTPVIKIAEPHGRISAIGAITISPTRSRFGFYFQLLPDNANFYSDTIVSFVDSVRCRIRKPVTVIWDQIPIHKSYPVERYLSYHKDVLVEPFPPYAPELNPVDFVWGHIKYGRLANYCPTNLSELRKKVTTELSRVHSRPDLLSSFFHATGLKL